MQEAKQLLRKQKRQKRDNLCKALRTRCSKRIFHRLIKLKEYKDARTVMFYLTYGSEVMTEQMIEAALNAGKKVVLPVVKGPGKMCAARIRELDSCVRKSVLGTMEPDMTKGKCPRVAPAKIDLVIVPGVSFSKAGCRLGYGKGFYDKWLSQFDAGKRVGIAFSCQLSKEVPLEPHDERVGVVITEKETIRIDQYIMQKGVTGNA